MMFGDDGEQRHVICGGSAVEPLYINKGISLDLMSTRNMSGYIFVVQEVVKYDLLICL